MSEPWIDRSIVLGEEDVPGEGASSLGGRHESPAEGSRARVLVVDDDASIVEALTELLEMQNFSVTTAEDFDGAITSAMSRTPSVAIVDVKLGPNDGIDLIPLLKAFNSAIRCVVMTAFRDAAHAERAREAGADEFLFKPLDPKELSEVLRGLTSPGPPDAE